MSHVNMLSQVLDNYDGNAWLGTRYRSTQSVPGEWPVSYHGTSKKGADGIIAGHYKVRLYQFSVSDLPFLNIYLINSLDVFPASPDDDLKLKLENDLLSLLGGPSLSKYAFKN